MKRRRALAAFALVVGTGCNEPQPGAQSTAAPPASDAEPRPDTAPPPTEPMQGFVLVRGGAALFALRNASTPMVSLRSVGNAAVFQAVRSAGERIQVRSLSARETSTHCAEPWFDADAFTLELWVDRRDLLTVTTRPVTVDFGDGTQLRMAPGVVLSPRAADEDLFDVSTDFAPGLAAAVPQRSVGHVYEPALLPQPANLVGLLPHSATVVLGDTTLKAGELGSRDAFESTPRAGGAQVLIGDRCVELRAHSDAAPVPRAPEPAQAQAAVATVGLAQVIGPRALGSVFTDSGAVSLAEGAALTWKNGDAAGIARTTQLYPTEIRRDGDRHCFVVRDLELCTPSENITEVERPAPPAPTEPSAGNGPAPDREIIQRTMRSSASIVKYCYEAQLKTNPKLEGKVVADLQIEATGVVASVRIEDNTTGNAALSRCLRRALKRLRFPELAAAAEVSYPFVFQTAG